MNKIEALKEEIENPLKEIKEKKNKNWKNSINFLKKANKNQ